MIEEFTFWLLSIVEDDPIPYEISSICFCYTKNGEAKTLFMGGCEYSPRLRYLFDYFPLEAQFFNCKTLEKFYDDKYFDKIVCNLIDESFSNDILKKEFYGKKIYFGEYKSKLSYLFTVK